MNPLLTRHGRDRDQIDAGKAQDRSTARATTRLIRKGLRVRERGVDSVTDCVAHSYGQVQDFFRANPCTALFRALLEIRDATVVNVQAEPVGRARAALELARVATDATL